MNINLRQLGDMLHMVADGTPEELATFIKAAGLVSIPIEIHDADADDEEEAVAGGVN